MKEMNVSIYTPHSSIKKPSILLKEMFSDLMASHSLAWRLADRDIKSQYRQSILGILWAFINPIINTLMWMFLNSTGIIKVANTAIPYPLYVFTGTMLWGIFTDAVGSPSNQTNNAKGILTKINFPKEALILSGIYQTLFNSVIKIVILMIIILIMGVYPNWTLLLFPIAFFTLILLGTSIGLFLTPIGMLYGDVGRIIPLFLQVLMYISPVLFPMPKTGWVCKLFNLNPLTPIIIAARNWLTGFPVEHISDFIGTNIICFVLLIFSWALYRISMPILVERMSS